MRSSLGGWDLAACLKRLTANAVVAIVLGSIPASSDTMESEGRQMKQCWVSYIKIQKNPPVNKKSKKSLFYNKEIGGAGFFMDCPFKLFNLVGDAVEADGLAGRC